LSCSPVITSAGMSSAGSAERRSGVRSDSSGSSPNWSSNAFSCCSLIAARTASLAGASQNSTFTSVAASRSPASSASSSASENARTSSDQAWPGSGGSASTRPLTRSGWAAARSSATRPPNDAPTSAARWIPTASSTARTSAAWLNEPVCRPERPKPRRSRRVRANRVCHAAHCGSHIRLSATPAWIRTTCGPSPACSKWSGVSCPLSCMVMRFSFVTDEPPRRLGQPRLRPAGRCVTENGLVIRTSPPSVERGIARRPRLPAELPQPDNASCKLQLVSL